MGMVLVVTAGVLALRENLCRREYANPTWVDFLTLALLTLTIYLIWRYGTRDDE